MCPFFSQILEFSIEISKLPQNVNEFQKVSTHSPFFGLITSLKTEASLSRLAKEVFRWFDMGKGNPKAFSYRFTGAESLRFLHNFMFLIKAMKGERDLQPVEFKLHVFAFTCLSLRDAVSLFVDSKLRENSLMILRKHARISLFPAHCFSKSTPKVPKYGPLLGMLSLFTPGRCLKCMGRGWPLTPWRVGKLNIKQFPVCLEHKLLESLEASFPS